VLPLPKGEGRGEGEGTAQIPSVSESGHRIRNSVAIIGAGITGLTAGFYLQRKGIPVTVYESSGRAGGVIQSIHKDGYLVEAGPNTILETSPKIAQLIRDAGLESRKLNPNPSAEARYVVRYKRPIAMPGSPLGFFTTNLFSVKAKFAVLREPFVPARRDSKEESVAEFVIRRLGNEFLDQAIDALVAGVYAGDPRKLSVTQAFPKLAQLEAKYGSLIKGQILGARERKRRGEVAKDRAPKFSFDEGLQVLTDTLRDRLGDSVHLNTSVTRLSQTPGGWSLDTRENSHESSVEHSAVIYAGTAFKLAELQIETQPKSSPSPWREGRGEGDQSVQTKRIDLNHFSEIRYPPVASLVLGFRREDVSHPCQGFGMLIPKVEGFKILGTIFSSSLFPNRAPTGHLTFTSYIGGERYPELASLPHDKLVALACEDLRILLGVKGKPTFEHSTFYPRAIPQYNVGYGKYRDLMSDIESKALGFFLAGHYRDGVSLSDSIVSGCHIADRLEKFLLPTKPRQPDLSYAEHQ
jgi:oxygen-dependent protoporphyrinogen oxidase